MQMRPAGPHVLVVDDDAFMRVYLHDALAEAGLEVGEARDGDEALAAIQAHPPRLVLLDLLMPGRSGLEALPRIRELSPDSRVIVISSLDAQGLITQALEAGAVDFVVKPFHPTELVAAVERALSGEEP